MLESGPGPVGTPGPWWPAGRHQRRGLGVMWVVQEEQKEQLFFEGEPDLEPPEELAVGELDDEAMLEEDLDNEDVLEQDVDDDLLADTLEDLVHVADDLGNEEASAPRRSPADSAEVEDDADEDLEILEVDDLEDLEESLDHLLEERLGNEETAGPEEEELIVAGPPSICREDEFVCRGCFLVRLRCQLADPVLMVCGDCRS